MEREKTTIKDFKERKNNGDDNKQAESAFYFLDNLDDPDAVFNRVCFLCNNSTPNLSSIQAKSRDEDDEQISDLEKHNFALGMIKIENQLDGPKKINRAKTKRDKKILKSEHISDHQDQSEREDILHQDSQAQLNEEEIEEINEGGETDGEDEKENDMGGSRDPSMQVDRTSSNFLKTNSRYECANLNRTNNMEEAPESPLPVIKINDNKHREKEDQKTAGVTPVDTEEKSGDSNGEETPNTSRQLKDNKK